MLLRFLHQQASHRNAATAATKKIILHPKWGHVTYIQRPRSRRLRLTYKPFQGLCVNLPGRMKPSAARAFIDSQSDWIQSAQARAVMTETRAIDFYQHHTSMGSLELKRQFAGELDALANEHGFVYARFTIRDQSSRWGSCSPNNALSLNQKLQFLPTELRTYVLLHELAHTRVKNHSRKFWKILYEILGESETLERRRRLRQYDFLFYPPPHDQSASSSMLLQINR